MAKQKIKIIGPRYLVGPLSMLGIEVFAAESEIEAKLALEKAAAEDLFALIFITERLAVDLKPEIDRLNQKLEMNVVLIPDNRGSIRLAASQMDSLIRNSIGAEVILRK